MTTTLARPKRAVGIVVALLLAGVLLVQSLSAGVVHAAGVLDQEFEGSGGAATISQFDTAQTFTVGRAGILTEVQIQIGRSSSTTLPLLVDIRRTVGGAPIEDNSDTLASVAVAVADVGTDLTLSAPYHSVDVSGFGIVVGVGEVLAIAARQPVTGVPSYTWRVGTSGGYAGGSRYFRDTTTTNPWGVAIQDLNFKTFVDDIPELTALATIETKLDTSLDATVSSRASQASVDALQTSVDAIPGGGGGGGTVDLTPVTDAIAAVEGKLDADLDESVSSRASQTSVDTLDTRVRTVETEILSMQLSLNDPPDPTSFRPDSFFDVFFDLDTSVRTVETEILSMQLSLNDPPDPTSFRPDSFFDVFFDLDTSVRTVEPEILSMQLSLNDPPDPTSFRPDSFFDVFFDLDTSVRTVETEILSMQLSLNDPPDPTSFRPDSFFDVFFDVDTGLRSVGTEILSMQLSLNDPPDPTSFRPDSFFDVFFDVDTGLRSVGTEILSMSLRTTGIETEIVALSLTSGRIETEIVALDLRSAGIETGVEAIEGKLDAIEAKIDDLEVGGGGGGASQASVDALEAKMDSLTATIALLEAKLQEIANAVIDSDDDDDETETGTRTRTRSTRT